MRKPQKLTATVCFMLNLKSKIHAFVYFGNTFLVLVGLCISLPYLA